MSKNKSANLKKFFERIKSFYSTRAKITGLRGKMISFIVVPVIITAIVAIVAVAIYVPDTVNKIKKSEVLLQGDTVNQQLNNLINEAERLSQVFGSDSNIVDAMVNADDYGVKHYAIMAASGVWNSQNALAPDFITITDSSGSIVARLQYSYDENQFQVVSGDDGKLMDSYEVIQALTGSTISNYDNNNNTNLHLKIAAPIRATELKGSEDTNPLDEEENNEEDEEEGEEDEEQDDTQNSDIIGSISLEFNLASHKYVDIMKGEKDIEISVFINGKRFATTFADGDKRRVFQQDLSEAIWHQIKDTRSNYVADVNLFGKSYISNYIPFITKEGNIAGIMEVAVRKVDLTNLYLITALVVCIITFGTIILILSIVNRTILKPVTTIVKAANTLSEGDVNVNLTATKSRDEIGQLTNAFLKMSENIKEQVELLTKFSSGDLTIDVVPKSERDLMGNSLKQMVETNNIIFSEIISAAEQVASGAKQIADGSQALSQGTTEQASAIEELSESISKIAAQTRMNAENANESNKLVNDILKNAEQGNQQMEKMLHAVQEISKAATEISKVIKVIDDIAFQTNILALNAAVEAARAGEYGKGFAVVAEEVRNLASKSAMAAKETTQLIENSIAKAKEGEDIAKKTAEALNTIVEGVEKTTNIISQIANASNEQATSIAQVNQGVEQVSKVVQTNAATAQESAAASEEMSTQSVLLKDMIRNKFKLKKMDRGSNAFEMNVNNDISEKEINLLNDVNSAIENTDFGKY